MRLLELASQFNAPGTTLTPDFLPMYGIRPRLGYGYACTCGRLGQCRDPGGHTRHLMAIGRPLRGPTVLAEQAKANPHGNLAVVCGRKGRSGLVVLQIDDTNALARLEERLGALPATVTSLSPDEGGATSLWFAHREGAADAPAHALGTGVTLVAGYRFAIVPGSVTAAGLYRWRNGACPVDLDFATLPLKWRKALQRVEPGARIFGLKPAAQKG